MVGANLVIPYELVIPSASRPHLLDEVLRTLFLHLDQPPERVLLHDDAVFPGKREEVAAVLRARVPKDISTIFLADDPPIYHGPALQRLLSLVSTDYVLYSQDDHQAVRDIPVSRALDCLDWHNLNQIRFNKRDTMDKKGREGEEFYKVVQGFVLGQDEPPYPLCIADHWYFQTGVWRVAAIKPVLDWWNGPGRAYGAFTEHMEVKVNQVFNGEWRGKHPAFPIEVPILRGEGAWNDPAVRARVHKTFIWGPIGERAFVQHLGTDAKDWALIRGNREVT